MGRVAQQSLVVQLMDKICLLAVQIGEDTPLVLMAVFRLPVIISVAGHPPQQSILRQVEIPSITIVSVQIAGHRVVLDLECARFNDHRMVIAEGQMESLFRLVPPDMEVPIHNVM